MNELERHEAAAVQSAKGAADSVKPAAESAVKTAKDAVKTVRDTAQDTFEDVRRRAAGIYDDAADAARDGYDSVARRATRIREAAPALPGQASRVASDFVGENPIMVGVVGLAAGLLLGALLPGTRRENQVFGRYADDVRDQGLRYARDVVEQGKHYVEESLQSARERA